MNNFPKALPDIKLYDLYTEKDDAVLLGSCLFDHYVASTRKKGMHFLELLKNLDGSNSLDDLETLWGLNKQQISTIINSFEKQGLLLDSNLNKRTELNSLSNELFVIKLQSHPKLNTNVYKKFACIGLMITFILMSINVFLFSAGSFNYAYPEVSATTSILSFILSFLIVIPSFLFHELCHVLLARANNLYPEGIHIRLYLFVVPLFYVKIPNIYSLDRKSRIQIMAAGMIGNLFLLNLFLIIYSISGEPFVFSCALSQFYIIFSNLSLFNLSDGYFIFSQIAKVQNLRTKMFRLLTGKVNLRNDFRVTIYTAINLVLITLGFFYMVMGCFRALGIELYGDGITVCVVLSVLFLSFYIVMVRYRFSKNLPMENK